MPDSLPESGEINENKKSLEKAGSSKNAALIVVLDEGGSEKSVGGGKKSEINAKIFSRDNVRVLLFCV